MFIKKVQAAAMAVVICSVVATFCLVSSAGEIQPADANSVTPSLSCPPGFVPQGNSCVCADWPREMVICDEFKKTASIRIGYCMTYDNDSQEVRVGECPQALYRKRYHKFYYPLPEEHSNLTEYTCGEFNSEGLLCGQCKDGFSVPPLGYGLHLQCVSCNSTTYGWLKFFAASLLPNTIILILIVIFSISIVSGPLNAFLFFGQITTGYSGLFTTQHVLRAQGNITYSLTVSQVMNDFYKLCNSYFIPDFIPSFCLTKHLTGLQALALDYISAAYPLLLLLVLYVCVELHDRNFRPLVWCWNPFHKYFVYCRRRLSPKTSIIDAFATFILLSYVKFLTVSHYILKFSHLYRGDGEKLNSTVMYYDGNIKYFHKQHLPYAILAIVIPTLLAILPIILLLYPTRAFQKCLTRCGVNSQALRTFVEIFQGCFKDGTNGTRDCRYFAGLYFILRIIVFLLKIAGSQVQTFVTIFLYLFTALLFAFVQPYKKYLNNVVDTIIFTIFAAVHILIISHGFVVLFYSETYQVLFLLMDILFILPSLYLILYLACWVIKRKTNCYQRLKVSKLLQYFFHEASTEDSDAAIPDRLLNPAEYEVLSGSCQAKEYKKPANDREHNRNTYGSI